MNLYEMTPTERDEFTPDAGFDTTEVSLTADMHEERMNAILEAWGWTEEKRDECGEYGELLNEEAWRDDTEAAYFVSVNSPAQTPIELFTDLMAARGWPRDPYGLNA